MILILNVHNFPYILKIGNNFLILNMDEETLDNEQLEKEPKKVNRFVPVILLSILLGTGFLFKLMHWPGHGLIIIVSLSLLASYAACFILYYHKNDFVTNFASAAFLIIAFRYILVNFIESGWYVAGAIFITGFVLFVLLLARKW